MCKAKSNKYVLDLNIYLKNHFWMNHQDPNFMIGDNANLVGDQVNGGIGRLTQKPTLTGNLILIRK